MSERLLSLRALPEMLEHHFALRDRTVSESAQVDYRPKALISQAFFEQIQDNDILGRCPNLAQRPRSNELKSSADPGGHGRTRPPDEIVQHRGG